MSNVVPLVAVAISLVSACLAAAAWWTSRERLRLDLYNRRFDVYSRTLDFYQVLLEWKPSGFEVIAPAFEDSPELRTAQKAFIKATREAGFLFEDSSGIQKQLEQVDADTSGIIGYKCELAPHLHGPERVSAHKTFTECWKRVNDAIPSLEEKMSTYLNFHALTSTPMFRR